jgi:acetyl esterase
VTEPTLRTCTSTVAARSAARSTRFVDITCRERAAGGGCVVIAVNERTAPEHRFPVGLHDCHTALSWAVEHADELGIRPHLITIGGGSAGANLAAALTLKARDEGGPAIAFQLLEVPVLDLTAASRPTRPTRSDTGAS